MEILDDFQVAEALKHNDIKQAIVDDGLLEKRKRSAVKTSVSNENKRSFPRRPVFRSDEKLWWLPRRNVCRGDKIAERAKTAFKCKAGFLYSLCIKPNPAELNKIFLICAR